MPGPIYNSTGRDDADYQSKVRSAVRDTLKKSLARKPKGGQSHYDRVTRHEEDHEEG